MITCQGGAGLLDLPTEILLDIVDFISPDNRSLKAFSECSARCREVCWRQLQKQKLENFQRLRQAQQEEEIEIRLFFENMDRIREYRRPNLLGPDIIGHVIGNLLFYFIAHFWKFFLRLLRIESN